MTAPMPEVLLDAAADKVIAVVRRHQDIADVFRLMKERLGLTNEFCDDAGGLAKGHCDKILGPSESKNWGPTTFDLFCEMFAVEFRVHVDLEAAKRMLAVWEGRERPLYPDAKVARISKKLIARAKPHVLRDLSRVGNAARNAMLPGEHRSKIARKAARARWRKKRHPNGTMHTGRTRRRNQELGTTSPPVR
jgi:hypothetical protein